MSGIMAIVALDGRPVAVELARAQLGAIAHRGEWEPRLWEGEGVALGHVNLPRTPEAEREFLPGSDATGRYWIIWDGRLDNRHELAGQLGLDSSQESAMTDPDYVLAAYQRWDAECVHKLLGDWAIVIWDSRERKLFCAKDPLGWRQLYYAERDGLVAVGSEPQQLFAGGFMAKEVNNEYVLRFLGDALQEPGETCYAGVMELDGGSSITVANGRITRAAFWKYPKVTKRPYKRPQEYVEEFTQLFDVAVTARLRANRPVGVFLSGGIDSSYITAIAAKKYPELLTISAHAPGTQWMDEREHAGLVAQHCGVRNVQVDISDCWSLSSRWLPDESFDQADQPPQGATHVRLAVATRVNGLGVVLGGEGADEWMTGNPSVGDSLAARNLWQAVKLARRRERPVRAFVRGAYQGLTPLGVRRSIRRLRGRGDSFSPFVAAHSNWESLANTETPAAWQSAANAALEWRGYRESAGAVIGWRDRNAFAPNRVDLRTPFNDLRIVELMASTPHWIKQFRGRRKDLLREAEYPVLPQSIPDRSDFGLYVELMGHGVADGEPGRVEAAIGALYRFSDINAMLIEREVRQWAFEGHRWWEPNWHAITAGLWLANSGVRHSGSPIEAPVPDDTNQKREGVMSR
ncbi:MAG TPA: asparagine synthase-related protein [Tepidiformaceae bacterium]|nr:asparagine synthase-related protein [Tepidiformaceae bacterium]